MSDDVLQRAKNYLADNAAESGADVLIQELLALASKRTDVKTLERLADQLQKDGLRGAHLNNTVVFNVSDYIREAIGAPLMWPSRDAGARAADAYYPGSPDLRHAFNAGVKWAVEQYHDLNLDMVKR